MELNAKGVIEELQANADAKKAVDLSRFFKTGPGGYAEGDQFLGIAVPVTRSIVKRYAALSLKELEKLLHSPFHEARLCALLILAETPCQNEQERCKRVDLYLRNTAYINNWDLVDLSAPKVIGEWVLAHPEEMIILETLSTSGHLWSERIAIVSTLSMIRKGQFEMTLKLSDRFCTHKHDLIQKAVGWMLREAGKRDRAVLEEFLRTHAAFMARTALRYAIERFSPEERRYWLDFGRNK